MFPFFIGIVHIKTMEFHDVKLKISGTFGKILPQDPSKNEYVSSMSFVKK